MASCMPPSSLMMPDVNELGYKKLIYYVKLYYMVKLLK